MALNIQRGNAPKVAAGRARGGSLRLSPSTLRAQQEDVAADFDLMKTGLNIGVAAVAGLNAGMSGQTTEDTASIALSGKMADGSDIKDITGFELGKFGQEAIATLGGVKGMVGGDIGKMNVAGNMVANYQKGVKVGNDYANQQSEQVIAIAQSKGELARQQALDAKDYANADALGWQAQKDAISEAANDPTMTPLVQERINAYVNNPMSEEAYLANNSLNTYNAMRGDVTSNIMSQVKASATNGDTLGVVAGLTNAVESGYITPEKGDELIAQYSQQAENAWESNRNQSVQFMKKTGTLTEQSLVDLGYSEPEIQYHLADARDEAFDRQAKIRKTTHKNEDAFIKSAVSLIMSDTYEESDASLRQGMQETLGFNLDPDASDLRNSNGLRKSIEDKIIQAGNTGDITRRFQLQAELDKVKIMESALEDGFNLSDDNETLKELNNMVMNNTISMTDIDGLQGKVTRGTWMQYYKSAADSRERSLNKSIGEVRNGFFKAITSKVSSFGFTFDDPALIDEVQQFQELFDSRWQSKKKELIKTDPNITFSDMRLEAQNMGQDIFNGVIKNSERIKSQSEKDKKISSFEKREIEKAKNAIINKQTLTPDRLSSIKSKFQLLKQRGK
jgi:hypothetical protein